MLESLLLLNYKLKYSFDTPLYSISSIIAQTYVSVKLVTVFGIINPWLNMGKSIEKVTAFVTRSSPTGFVLLLFEHPTAGIQIPAGTVNHGETPAAAAIREVAEETGLRDVNIVQYLGVSKDRLPNDLKVIAKHTKVYAQPDLTSFDWAYLPPGITVSIERWSEGFAQISYTEFNKVPDPQFVSMSIKGWVPEEVLADSSHRHFYHLEFKGKSKDRWETFADHHLFRPFWAPLNDLPDIIPPQDEWLVYLEKKFNPNLENGIP
jgi:8-oxo-dGTP pyrophosphatase MutT (NUDIX family)